MECASPACVAAGRMNSPSNSPEKDWLAQEGRRRRNVTPICPLILEERGRGEKGDAIISTASNRKEKKGRVR